MIAGLRLALRWPVERFDRKLSDPERAQRETLSAIIKEIAKTAYGQTHGISADDEYVEFRKKLPIAAYEDFEPWLKVQMREENQALAPGKVLFYEKTSGSSGPVKYIPYTGKLKRTVHRMFLLWLGDILNHGPRLKSGRTFISVSPPFEPKLTEHGIPLGVCDERSYLARWTRKLIDPYFITFPNLRPFRHSRSFHVALCRKLLAAEDLEILSIWSPSYLSIILDEIIRYKSGLLNLLEQQGTSSRRLSKLHYAIGKDWTMVWPHLKLLSCWDSGHSHAGAARLRELFPGVMVQGKGLLATEAPMTLPWIRANGAVPLIDEIFFEFEEAPGRVRLLHEIQPNREYSLILSQKGGLARYRIGDRVRVNYLYKKTPCLEFVGREGGVSDLVGEKLHESFVSQALRFLPLGNSRFQTLVPVRKGKALPHYLLLADAAEIPEPLLALKLDEALSRAHRYREARFLGQLGPAQIRLGPHFEKLTVDHSIKKGLKWGDIKPRALIPDFDASAIGPG